MEWLIIMVLSLAGLWIGYLLSKVWNLREELAFEKKWCRIYERRIRETG